MGLVDAVFADMPHLPGDLAIAHNRYSTSGCSIAINAGPFTDATDLGPIALAHNGNIVNAGELRELAESRASCRCPPRTASCCRSCWKSHPERRGPAACAMDG